MNAATNTPQITPETVRHVAKLASLELTEQDLAAYQQDLASILGMINQLNNLGDDVLAEVSEFYHAGVHVIDSPDNTGLRPDEPAQPFTREELMQNAPAPEEGFFRIPNILAQ